MQLTVDIKMVPLYCSKLLVIPCYVFNIASDMVGSLYIGLYISHYLYYDIDIHIYNDIYISFRPFLFTFSVCKSIHKHQLTFRININCRNSHVRYCINK